VDSPNRSDLDLGACLTIWARQICVAITVPVHSELAVRDAKLAELVDIGISAATHSMRLEPRQYARSNVTVEKARALLFHQLIADADQDGSGDQDG
jgi:hypothetical protein